MAGVLVCALGLCQQLRRP